MFNEKDNMYIGIALLYSRISKAERLKVGCCFVTQNNVVLGGVNVFDESSSPIHNDENCVTMFKLQDV